MAQAVFEKIYTENAWGKGSGDGSTPEATIEYRAFLTKFLADHKDDIKTIADIGSGDWQFSRLMDWSNHDYTGYDCVATLVETNNRTFAGSNVRFRHLDILTEELPMVYDLIILKDVLQHWTNGAIVRTLTRLQKKAKYILVTNCADQARYTCQDTPLGGMRALSSSMVPLILFDAKPLITFGRKESSLICGTPPDQPIEPK